MDHEGKSLASLRKRDGLGILLNTMELESLNLEEEPDEGCEDSLSRSVDLMQIYNELQM